MLLLELCASPKTQAKVSIRFRICSPRGEPRFGSMKLAEAGATASTVPRSSSGQAERLPVVSQFACPPFGWHPQVGSRVPVKAGALEIRPPCECTFFDSWLQRSTPSILLRHWPRNSGSRVFL